MGIIDWSTAAQSNGCASPEARRGPHQADEGARAQLMWGTSIFKQDLAQKVAALTPHGRDEDCLSWINLSLHNECSGPFLARAFVHCCRLYEKRRRELGGEGDVARHGDNGSSACPDNA